MKINKIILPVAAVSMLLTGCDDQIMEWGTPDGHGKVTTAEIPLTVKEVLANYDNIKAYAPAGNLIGIGMGADMYVENAKGQGDLANANYQLFTPGNAMKMGVVVQNNGSLKFETIDKLIASLKENNMPLYGHNFIWHTQQQQTYLKSLIAPDVQIVSDPNGKIENIVENSDFENGNTNGWGAWSSAGCKQAISEKGDGYEGDYAIKLTNPAAGANYSAQAFYTLPQIKLEVGDVYILSFYVKADHIDPDFQAELQNRTSYSAKKYFHQPINAAGKWYYFEEEFEITEDIVNSEPSHITIDFGGGEGIVWLDNVQFGKKKEGPTNYCSNGSFENGVDGWNTQNKGDGIEAVEAADAIDGKHVVKMTASASSSNYWDLQLTSAAIPTFPGEKVRLSFYVKSNQVGAGRVSFSNALSNQWPWMNWTGAQSSWTENFETSTNWMLIDVVLQNFSTDFKDGEATWTFNLDFGSVPGVTYYIDDVKVTVETAAGVRKRSQTRASNIIYTFKTPEEKREALLGAMDSWIKGMADHLKETGVQLYGYDVINEPINDGDCKVRGVDNVFGGSWTENDVTYYDAEPVENEEEGLNLNWSTQVGNNHFYWGYYVKDYAVQAFQKARKYLPAETKLFVNDYNLENNPKKLEALIKFAKDIDAANGTPIVDGIGTQMHVSISPTDDAAKNAEIIADLKAKVDAQFQTMAATGKLVRVTELDITIGTGSPSSAQYQAQADAYRVIAESYLENVPAAQQSGITIWSLSDNEDEHESWLNGQVPNLFDKDYLRKWAYKGFCDGLVGEDLGLKYGGEDYKAFYERNNVSSTVK